MQPLWDFAGELYAHKPLAQHCIALQSSHDVDVCILLALAWLAQHRVEISTEQLQQLLANTAKWRLEVTAKLRAIRMLLSSANALPAGYVETGKQTLYEQFKQLELHTEQATLNGIQAQFEGLEVVMDEHLILAEPLIQRNFHVYLVQCQHCEDILLQQTVKQFVAALNP